MKFAIRVDASQQMGTGHVMRCLTLAEQLQADGHQVCFLCREHQGDLIDSIEAKGFEVFPLTRNRDSKRVDVGQSLQHASWLGVSQLDDVSECLPILSQYDPHWVVVDHYGIDKQWELEVQKQARKIFVIDDLADREHSCELLLDQTYGRKAEDYSNLVPANSQVLAGSFFSLLRNEFAEFRACERVLENKIKKTWLISLGGVDPDDYTSIILALLEAVFSGRRDEFEFKVIMGKTAPHIDKIVSFAEKTPLDIDVLTGVTNMAEMMRQADFAIGAAGATTWERCCLGLPAIQVVIADNQKTIARNLHEIGAIKLLEGFSVDEFKDAINHLEKFAKKVRLVSSAIVDGQGCRRVVEQLCHNNLPPLVKLQPATENECEFFYNLQTIEGVRTYFRNPDVPSWNNHQKWYQSVLISSDMVLFMIRFNDTNVGMVRLDSILSEDIEISVIVDPAFSGQGIGLAAIKLACDLDTGAQFTATVHEDNIASSKLFAKAGFKPVSQDGKFVGYKK